MLRVQKLIDKNERLQERNTVSDRYVFGKNVIDFNAQEAFNKKNERFRLSKKETMLLKLLIENKNQVVKTGKNPSVRMGLYSLSEYAHHR